MSIRLLLLPLVCAALLGPPPARSEAEFALRPFADDLQAMTSLNGQPRLLQFWASWCGSCFRVMDDLARLADGFPGLGYLAISIDADMTEAAAALSERPVFAEHPDRFWFDAGGRLGASFGVVTTPTLVLLDVDGRERHRHLGHLNSADLQALRRQLAALFPLKEQAE